MKWRHGKTAATLRPGDCLEGDPVGVIVDVVRAGDQVEIWTGDADPTGMPSLTVSAELMVPVWEPVSDMERRLALRSVK